MKIRQIPGNGGEVARKFKTFHSMIQAPNIDDVEEVVFV